MALAGTRRCSMMGLVQMARRCCSREPGGFPCCTPRPRDDPPSNIAIDRKSMIDSLYGPVAEPLNGMMVRKSSLGWNPNFKEYPYDPAKAKQLVEEAGAVGQPIELISRNGIVPRIDEVTELFANQVNQTGLKLTVRSLEVGQWRTINRQVKPGEQRSDLHLTSASDPVLDSSRTLNS